MPTPEREKSPDRRLIPVAARSILRSARGGRSVKHYRVNKLAKPNGDIVQRKDILAKDDKQAIQVAAEGDCPICEVWHEGKKVGSIL